MQAPWLSGLRRHLMCEGSQVRFPQLAKLFTERMYESRLGPFPIETWETKGRSRLFSTKCEYEKKKYYMERPFSLGGTHSGPCVFHIFENVRLTLELTGLFV